MINRKIGRRRSLFTGLSAALMILLSPKIGVAKPSGGWNTQYDPIVQKYAQKYKVPADLIHSIILSESNYNQWAVSPKGACGLMQLMPETAKQYGVKNVFDADQNIAGGVGYLKDLCRLYNNQTRYVLAAYNAGQEALKKYGGIPPYPETRNYIQRVMASYKKQYITTSPPIRTFTKPSGTRVFTNDPYYHLNRRKEDKSVD